MSDYTSTSAPLIASSFPPGIWPVRFKYSQKSENIANTLVRGTVDSSWGCSLDLVGNVLVATIGGQTFTAPLDGIPAATFSGSIPLTGDAFFVSISQRTIGILSTTRHVELRAEAHNTVIHPTYGPFNGGPLFSLYASYDPSGSDVASRFNARLNVTVQEVNKTTAFSCDDRNVF